jgi:hypothetical protein
MSKYICSTFPCTDFSYAEICAEALTRASKGMFSCLEGQVWISTYPCGGGYEIWLILEGKGVYCPSPEELKEACLFEGLDREYYLPSKLVLKSYKALTELKVIKWSLYS